MKLSTLYIGLEGVFEEDSVVKLYVEVDGLVTKVSQAEGDDGARVGESRVLLKLCVFGPGVFVDCFVLDNMEII